MCLLALHQVRSILCAIPSAGGHCWPVPAEIQRLAGKPEHPAAGGSGRWRGECTQQWSVWHVCLRWAPLCRSPEHRPGRPSATQLSTTLPPLRRLAEHLPAVPLPPSKAPPWRPSAPQNSPISALPRRFYEAAAALRNAKVTPPGGSGYYSHNFEVWKRLFAGNGDAPRSAPSAPPVRSPPRARRAHLRSTSATFPKARRCEFSRLGWAAACRWSGAAPATASR